MQNRVNGQTSRADSRLERGQPCPRVPGFRPSSRGQGCPRSCLVVSWIRPAKPIWKSEHAAWLARWKRVQWDRLRKWRE